jgi:hypothetical protein
VPRGYVSVNFNDPVSGAGLGNSVPTTPDKTLYDVPIEVPIDAPAGIYKLTNIAVGSINDMYRATLKFQPQSFEVIQPASFSLPTEARVTINLSQKQLLQSAAIQVQHKIESLKATLATLREDSSRVPMLLRQNILDADQALSTTEKEFLELTTAATERNNANVFFGDLHKTYEMTLRQVHASLYGEGAIRPVSFQRGLSSQDALEAAVLRSLEHNELAYDIVAATQSLIFDLDVRSYPEGAKVSYGRRGDSSFTSLQYETDSQIKGLVFAIWHVRFIKQGYEPIEIEHNPFTDKNHVLTVELTPSRNKKGDKQH